MSQEEVLDRYFSQNQIFEANNVNEAVMRYDPQDEAETCRFIRRDGTCYKGKNCKLRHDPLTDGFTRDRQLVYNQPFVDSYELHIGQHIDITISHVVNVQIFYGQIRHNTIHARRFGDQTIKRLADLMNKPEVIKKYKKLETPPSIGEIVIAQHWNTFWYRAQVRYVDVLSSKEEIRVEVFIVDFGDNLCVMMSELRKIVPEFMSLPFQAIECRLFNVKQKSGVDPEEGKREFDAYLGRTFRAQIIANPGHLQVILTTNNGNDIGQKLIDAGCAEQNLQHIFPSRKELFLID